MLRKLFLFGGLTFAVTLAPAFVSSATAAPITYTIEQFPGAPTVNGTFTTDGTIGQLSPGNITAWTYTVVGSPDLTYSSSIGTGAATAIQGAINASADRIYFDVPSDQPPDFPNLSVFHDSGGFALDRINWFGRFDAVVFQFGGTTVPNDRRFSRLSSFNQYTIAAVPEPTSLSLIGLAGVALLRRRRR